MQGMFVPDDHGHPVWRPDCRVRDCGNPAGEDTTLQVRLTIGSIERLVVLEVCEGHHHLVASGAAELSVNAA